MATLTTQGVLTDSGIEGLYSRLEEMNQQIKQEEVEKDQLQYDISLLTEKLIRINKSLPQRRVARAELERTIAKIKTTITKLWEECWANPSGSE